MGLAQMRNSQLWISHVSWLYLIAALSVWTSGL